MHTAQHICKTHVLLHTISLHDIMCWCLYTSRVLTDAFFSPHTLRDSADFVSFLPWRNAGVLALLENVQSPSACNTYTSKQKLNLLPYTLRTHAVLHEKERCSPHSGPVQSPYSPRTVPVQSPNSTRTMISVYVAYMYIRAVRNSTHAYNFKPPACTYTRNIQKS